MDLLGSCLVCFEDIELGSTAVEYKPTAESCWFPARFCRFCIETLQRTQFHKYCNDLATTTCAKEQRALLERGPPINMRDKNAFPEAGDNEIYSLRSSESQIEVSAKLDGSLQGKARLQFLEDQKQFIIHDDPSED